MSELTRRDWLRIGASMSLAAGGEGLLQAQDAQHVHQAVAGAKAAGKGAYKPVALTSGEYATLERLAELIIPTDERSAGAREAGAAAYIDFMCSLNQDLKQIYTGGLRWLDDSMHRRAASSFVAASPAKQSELLDAIAYRKDASPEWNPGIAFFVWVRNMVVDAYYTSPTGVKELGFLGNGAVSEFHVPKEAVDYAVSRSPFREG